MEYLTLWKVFKIHDRVTGQSGGSYAIRDMGALESALAQPRMTFGGLDLYKTLPEKAAALGYSLIMNHPFIDGNKRVGHAAMEAFLELNGHRINAPVGNAEHIILDIAAGKAARHELVEWLDRHVVESV